MDAVATNTDPSGAVDKQYDATIAGMDAVRGLLYKGSRIKRERVSRKPSGVSEYTMIMASPLLNRKRQPVGSIRVYVTVGKASNDIRVRIQWTRNAFGFWYVKDAVLVGAVDHPLPISTTNLMPIMAAVKHTADGTTILKSMNRTHKKKKKNKVRDKAIMSGLVMG